MTQPDGGPAFREVEIDVSALARNITRALALLPDGAPRVIDLGADAFGCDAALVAPVAHESGCSHALVGRVSEALALAPIASGLTVVCSDPLATEAAADLDAAGVVIAHRNAASAIAALEHGVGAVAVMGDAGRGASGVPLDALDAVRAAASDAGRELLVVDPAAVLGAAVFGLGDPDALGLPLDDPEPVMTLWAPVVGLKSVGGDEGVSYGYRYRTADETTLALVSLGYADGLDRAAGNTLLTRVGEQTCTIAGRVAMDAFVLDVGADAAVAVGDRVVVWGDARTGAPTIADAAARLGTHSAELATRLTARPRRRAVGGTS